MKGQDMIGKLMKRRTVKLLTLGLGLVVMGVGAASAASYRMMFDVLSPRGISCTVAEHPDINVRMSRGITGNPVILLSGKIREAEIICELPDGSLWQATAQQKIPIGSWRTDGMVAVRAGASSGITIIERSRFRSDVIHRSFMPLR